jgi:hypothetical protein
MSTKTVIDSGPVVKGQHIFATAPTDSNSPDSITNRRWVDLGGIWQRCQFHGRGWQQHNRAIQHDRSGREYI